MNADFMLVDTVIATNDGGTIGLEWSDMRAILRRAMYALEHDMARNSLRSERELYATCRKLLDATECRRKLLVS